MLTMDRLTEQQRTAISKMSDERLRAKLVQAGYQEEVVGQLDQSMMLTLAKYMADEEERTLAAVEVQERTGENLDDSTKTQTQAGAMSLEERRLFLEERRFQMEERCLLYTSPSPRDRQKSRMPSSA